MIELLTLPAVRRTLFVLGGVLTGVLAERVLVRQMQRVAKWTESEWDDVLADAIQWVPTLWCMAGGVYLATRDLAPAVYGPIGRALMVVMIGSVVVAMMRAAGGWLQHLTFRADSPLPAASLVSNVARLVIGVIGVFIILLNLGLDITPILTVGGLGGLAVALALQEPLGNLFAGAQIILAGQVRTHDYIMLAGGEEGYVTDVKARNTTIRTFPDGNLVVIPNSALASSIVKNFSLPQKSLWVSVDVGVSYDSDLAEVERVSLDVARDVLCNVEGGIPDREPVLRFQAFADSSVNFTVRLFVREFTDQFLIRHEFVKRLHRRYAEEGIVIPFPIRTVHLSRTADEAGSSSNSL